MPDIAAEDCLALVEASPEAVARHDRDGWLRLFALQAVVEDPVGSAPHRVSPDNRARLGQFYDTFIAPNQIHFEVDQDIVCDLHVMRDLTIVIAMSASVTVRVPVHLLYELVRESGELRIQRLAAHWELGPMLRQQMSGGLAFLPVGIASFARMLRHLGVAGMGGFTRALASAGEQGKQQLRQFAVALAAHDAFAISKLMASKGGEIYMPWGSVPVSIEAIAAQGGELSFGKMLSAGRVITATFEYTVGGNQFDGVLLCQLAERDLAIERLVAYWEA